MGRPKLVENEKRVNFTLTMSRSEKEEIEKLAKEYGMSSSGLIRYLVKKELKNI